jgi:hypothetical protein
VPVPHLLRLVHLRGAQFNARAIACRLRGMISQRVVRLGLPDQILLRTQGPKHLSFGSCLSAPVFTAHANASLGCSVLSWKRRASFSYAIKVHRQISGRRGRVLLSCRGARDHALSAAIVGLGRTRRRLNECKLALSLQNELAFCERTFA